MIGVPVIIAISIFNGIEADASPLIHTVGSAVVGFGASFVMLYLSLKYFNIRSKYDSTMQRSLSTN
jgi:hypothetical protein